MGVVLEMARKVGTDRQDIDALGSVDALGVMLSSHLNAVAAIEVALPEIVAAAERMAETLRAGGTLHYAAAGSSGLMALADACELPGTFGVSPDQIRVSMAGGVPTACHLPGGVEDDTASAISAAGAVRPEDVAIVISASGTTPYATAFAREAREHKVPVIAIANRSDSALAQIADLVVEVPTEPEVVDGSTRLGAGTAQKVILNMISTLAGVLLGHVHQGRMVNFIPDNEKLRARAQDVVAQIADVTEVEAEAALRRSQGDIKLAILLANGAEIEAARASLGAHKGRLGDCLCAIQENRATMR